MVLQIENSNVDRLAFIDGLRGLAIFAVIYHHLFSRFTVPGYESFELGGFSLFEESNNFVSQGNIFDASIAANVLNFFSTVAQMPKRLIYQSDEIMIFQQLQ